ncbi:replicative DNA helicase [Candidatus Poribacteria bacterium]|nr:replicative DNA helicase [Candidatus Poribacteria bacterium]MBP95655.1 replicative DNA helicase [Candidatus Poribacteria bacterium]MCH2575758.1 replicative DNA helicase [Candidatus Poribacteria bacterium]OUT63144.1 MAG: replicative DNA helicase [bacterium TMED15]|tara:strand:+ start:57 stop:1385 length:1329 start_codon:yes stop_codon:yes gene_type:complete
MQSVESLHDRQAEQFVLGSMLTDATTIPLITPVLGETPDAFFTTDHQLIYSAILASYERNSHAEPGLVAHELERGQQINRAGGNIYLYDLQARIVETESAEFYAQIVQEKSTRRRFVVASKEIQQLALNQEEEIQTVQDQIQEAVFRVSYENRQEGFVAISSVVRETLQDVLAAANQDDDILGVATGFVDFDILTSGLQKGALHIIAARPGMGKTTFVLNVAQNIAIEKELSVAIFSLEMPAKELTLRMLAAEAGVEFSRIRSGYLNDNHWDLVAEAVARFEEAPIFLNCTWGLTIQRLRSEARRLKSEHPNLCLVAVDYLQLVSGSNKSGPREQEIAEISRSLKSLAVELELTVIACAQLSREVERRPDKRPVLSDLRESGSIEQDADLVAFLYRDDYYNEQSEEAGIADLMVKKHRSGPTGTIQLEFVAEQMRFDNCTRY